MPVLPRHPLTSAALDPLDAKNIVVTFGTAVGATDTVTVQYAGTGVTSADGGVLHGFGPVEVYNSGTLVLHLPGTVQAEDYTSMSGVQTETTTDLGGGVNVGYIDAGDWMEYAVNAGVLTNAATFRVAALSTAGKIAFSCDGTVLSTFDLPVTGGWQVWQSVFRNIVIPSGAHTLRITAVTGGFNLNWITFQNVNDVQESVLPRELQLLQNYPNPFNPETTISYELPATSQVTITVTDVLGRVVEVLKDGIGSARDPGGYVEARRHGRGAGCISVRSRSAHPAMRRVSSEERSRCSF